MTRPMTLQPDFSDLGDQSFPQVNKATALEAFGGFLNVRQRKKSSERAQNEKRLTKIDKLA